ncbi:MAG TPA: TraB/GumN family protein [Opitutaceae bacterium]
MVSRLLIALLGLVVTGTALPAQSSVWKVTRGKHSLYLGGTLHLLRPSDFPLPAEFNAAFAASATLVFETDITRLQSPEMQQVVAARGVFADGRSLETELSPKAWNAVQDYCAKSGTPIAQVRHYKPWLFTVIVTATELRKAGISAEGVDVHFFKRAGIVGKTTDALETFEQQVDFLVNMGAGHESEMIAQTLEDLAELPRILEEVLTAWRTGDISAIDSLLLDDVRSHYPAIFKDLIVDRNNAWLPKLDAMLKSAEVEFVLVGAGHLAGPEGLLNRLRRRGYSVEQIKAAAK